MPGAWEILKARRERVLCCVIMPPELRHSRAWTRMWKNLQLGQGGEVIDVQGLPYDAARNHAVKVAVDGDWGYLFFLDSDTIPPSQITAAAMWAACRSVMRGWTPRAAPMETGRPLPSEGGAA